MIGLVGVVPLALLDLLYVLVVRRPEFSSILEAAAFGGATLALLLAAGALLGCLVGLVTLGVSSLTKLLAKKRVEEPRWMALICSFICLPLVAVTVARAFAGRQAQQIPGKAVIAPLLGLLALLAAYGAFRLLVFCRDRFRIRRWGPAQAARLGGGLLLAAAGVYLADQLLLRKLYPLFHLGLTLGAVALCQLAAGTFYIAHRPRQYWMGRLAEPDVAIKVLVAAVALGAVALGGLGRSERLRSVMHQHTVVVAKLLRLTGPVGADQARPAPAAKAASATAKPAQVATVRGPRRPERSVLLLTVDALRADRLGIHGHRGRTSPNLDRWARGAAVFERGYCQIPHTSASLTSLLTGSYRAALGRGAAAMRVRTLPEVLRRYNYKTAAFFPPSVFYIHRQRYAAYERSRYGFEYVKYQHLNAAQRVDQVLAYLRQQRPRRFMVWAHFFDPHEPYLSHPGLERGRRAEDRYDSEVAYVDQHLGRLLKYVQQHHPETIVALTADHGEAFGEHGAHYHGSALFDPQVRVPLIVRVPGVRGRRVAGPAQVIDLPLTLLSVLDVPAPATMSGTDLGPWLAGEDPRRLPPTYAELGPMKMVVQGHHKLLCDVAQSYCQLYDLAADPGERRNLIDEKPQLRGRLEALLWAWLAGQSTSAAADDPDALAQRLLERGRRKDPGSVEGLIGLTRGPTEVQRQAVNTLQQLRAPAARKALVLASKEKDPGVAIPAAVGAALLGHKAGLDRMGSLLARSDLPPALRRQALLALAAAGRRSATLPLGRLLAGGQLSIEQRVELITALGRLGDPAAEPALTGQLAHVRTRRWAMQALGQVRAPGAVGALMRSLLKDRFISWRQAAARALGKIRDRRALAPLQHSMMHEVEPAVAAEAAAALSALNGLPAPGTRALTAGASRCEADQCVIPLELSCADVAAQELVLVLSHGAAGASGTPAVARRMEQRPMPVGVLCGEQRVSTLYGVRGREVWGALVAIPAAARGALTLTAASSLKLGVTHAALRGRPRR